MAAFQWNVPAASTVAVTTFPDDFIAGINTVVAAGSVLPGAVWEVANYSSTSPKSVLLRKINGAPGRIIFFGQNGSTPNAAACSGTATASVPYIGYSATSTVNTPDASFLSAAPLAASDYIPAVRCFAGAAGTDWRFSYAEFEDGFYFLVGSVSFNGMGVAGAGELIEDIDGENISAILGSGASGSTQWAYTVSNSGGIIPATIAASYTGGTAAALIVRYDGENRSAYRATIMAASATMPKLHDTTNSRAHFLPIPLVFNTSDVTYSVLGKMRQVAFGPNCIRETVLVDADGVAAYGHHLDVDASLNQPGFWFVDLEV
jgi:hypothetical protein